MMMKGRHLRARRAGTRQVSGTGGALWRWMYLRILWQAVGCWWRWRCLLCALCMHTCACMLHTPAKQARHVPAAVNATCMRVTLNGNACHACHTSADETEGEEGEEEELEAGWELAAGWAEGNSQPAGTGSAPGSGDGADGEGLAREGLGDSSSSSAASAGTHPGANGAEPQAKL